jgi:single-strand DNA-binding protein
MSNVKGTINTVELLGWLGGDPELRVITTGSSLCRFSVATKRFGGQDESGRREIETDWTNVEAWDKLADLCNNYLHKGSRVFVIGALRTDSWTDKTTNQPRSRTYVRAEQVLFLDAKPGLPGEAIAASEAELGEEVPF